MTKKKILTFILFFILLIGCGVIFTVNKPTKADYLEWLKNSSGMDGPNRLEGDILEEATIVKNYIIASAFETNINGQSLRSLGILNKVRYISSANDIEKADQVMIAEANKVVEPVTDEEVNSIIGYKWTLQKRESFTFPDGNNYEVVLGVAKGGDPNSRYFSGNEGQVFLLHYDRGKRAWLNIWYLPEPICSFASPEYIFPTLNIIQKPESALVAVQSFAGGNGGITSLVAFTVNNSGEVRLQKDMYVGTGSVETIADSIVVTGSGSVGVHVLSLVNGEVIDSVTPRSEMGDKSGTSTQVYFLLDKSNMIVPASPSLVDIEVGETVVFIPQDDSTRKEFDNGEISIYTNAWNDGPVNMCNANMLKSGNSYTFKRVGTFDFILAGSDYYNDNPKPTFTINVKP